MASTTSNLGLTKPAGTDKALVSVINSNSEILDGAAGGLMDALAIVAQGNTHGAISAGQYVYVRGHDTLAEGLYTANSAIAANATLTNSNLTADSVGGLNSLNSKIVSLADAGTQNNYNADFGTSSKIAPAVFPSNSSNTPWSAANTAGYVVKFGRTYGRDIAISQEGIKTRSVLNGSVGAWDDILFSRAHITSVELPANGSKSLTFNSYGMCLTATSRDASSYDTLAFVAKGGVHSIVTASVITYSMSNSILTITNTTSWPVRLVVVDLNHYLSPVTIS